MRENYFFLVFSYLKEKFKINCSLLISLEYVPNMKHTCTIVFDWVNISYDCYQ